MPASGAICIWLRACGSPCPCQGKLLNVVDVIPDNKDWSNKTIVTPGNGIGTAIEGDVNKDGKVNIGDAQRILVAMANDDSSPLFDVNRDNKVNIGDYQRILVIMANQ